MYIAHLSDLHIAPADRPEVSRLDVELCAKLRNFREERGCVLDLLVLSGDLVNHGSGDYTRVQTTVDELCKATGVTGDQVFIVPGNHDVQWEQCRVQPFYEEVVRGLKENPESINTITETKISQMAPGFQAFCAFAGRFPFYDRARLRLPGFFRHELTSQDNLRLRLCGVNSALVSGPLDASIARPPTDRVLGLDLVEQMLPSVDQAIVTVVVSHYPPWCVHEHKHESFIDALTQTGVILLTGHCHQDRMGAIGAVGPAILHLSAGSTSGHNWRGRNHCRILELDPGSDSPVVHDFVWSADTKWRAFEPLPVAWEPWKRLRLQAGAPSALSVSRSQSIAKECREAGLVEIRGHQNKDERDPHFDRILNAVAKDTDLIIVGRSLIDWSCYDQLFTTLLDNGVRIKLGLLDPNTVIRDAGAAHTVSGESWIERPIETDWAFGEVRLRWRGLRGFKSIQMQRARWRSLRYHSMFRIVLLPSPTRMTAGFTVSRRPVWHRTGIGDP